MGSGMTEEKSYRKAFGSMSVDNILRTDWEKNYKDKGIPLEVARASFKVQIDTGSLVFRMGNTLILFVPEDDFQVIKFHTITANGFEEFLSIVLKFLISAYKTRGAQVAYTYLNDKTIYDVIKKGYGSYMMLEPNDDDSSKGKYKLIIEIGSLVREMEKRGKEPNGLG
jgi:hypothetical protein